MEISTEKPKVKKFIWKALKPGAILENKPNIKANSSRKTNTKKNFFRKAQNQGKLGATNLK